MKETLETVVQGGALGLLALVLAGGIYIAAAVLPSIKGFFERLTASLGALETRAAVIETKVDAVAGRVEKLGDAVAAEAFEVKTALGEAERRLAHAIRREQDSDPPARPSLHTPAAGIPLPRARLTP